MCHYFLRNSGFSFHHIQQCKINLQPNPEWRVTVEHPDERENMQLHLKNTYKLTQVHEFKTVLFEQALIVAPPIKQEQFDLILKSISTKDKIEIIEPAAGTSPLEVLQKLLEKHIYGAQATSFMSFASGRPLVDEKFAWFVFDKFYDKLKKIIKNDSTRALKIEAPPLAINVSKRYFSLWRQITACSC